MSYDNTRPPGPDAPWADWKAFHRALKRVLHTHDDLLLVCDIYGPARITWDASPWTTGGCAVLAQALTQWINNPRRATWQMLSRRNPQDASQRQYAHALVVYKHNTLGSIYFDGVMLTRNIRDLHRLYRTSTLSSRTRDANNYMDENFGIPPTRDPRVIELMLHALNSALGRWPK